MRRIGPTSEGVPAATLFAKVLYRNIVASLKVVFVTFAIRHS
jgi:hypothetical protein